MGKLVLVGAVLGGGASESRDVRRSWRFRRSTEKGLPQEGSEGGRYAGAEVF